MIPPYIKWGIILALALGYGAGAFWLGGEHSRKVAAKEQLADVLRIVKDSQERQRKLQEALDKLPKSERTIRETVRLHPAPCERPAPVADGLREAIDKANRARKVSSNT